MPETNLDQEFFANIGGNAYSTNKESEAMIRPTFTSNVDEADMRIWLHSLHSVGNRILVFSPDTDVYHIGLTQIYGKHVIIQLSKSLNVSPKLLDLNALLDALEKDPDLSSIQVSLKAQSLFVCTGCDYTSFFVGLGKSSFLSAFYQYATFIASGVEPIGSIRLISLNRKDYSLYSFLRLVGCAYFRLHASVFEHASPVALYNSVSTTRDVMETHTKWLDVIRNGVWLRADSEANNVPTVEALAFHWHRCLWVLGLWNSSTENEIQLPGTHAFNTL